MNLKLSYLVFIFQFSFLTGILAQLPAERISKAHAHNDYEKCGRKDFVGAWKQGFSSFEIDVFPRKNQLKVAHIPLFLGLRGNFEKRYIKPIAKLYEQNPDLFKHTKNPLVLMVDVKRNSSVAYHQLRNLAIQYEDLFTVWYPKNDSVKWGPLELLVSGAKPYYELSQDSVWYMRIDGSFDHIGKKNYKSSMIPRVSSSYGSHFKWRGSKKGISSEELNFLRKTVAAAHSEGRTVRFWAMPNKKAVWELLHKEGVDWLNVDRIKKFRRWWEKVEKRK